MGFEGIETQEGNGDKEEIEDSDEDEQDIQMTTSKICKRFQYSFPEIEYDEEEEEEEDQESKKEERQDDRKVIFSFLHFLNSISLHAGRGNDS